MTDGKTVSIMTFNVLRGMLNIQPINLPLSAACAAQTSLTLVAGRDTCDAVTEFDCSGMSSNNCISLTAVCDGRRDCHDAEDENTTLCATRIEHSQFTSLPVIMILLCCYIIIDFMAMLSLETVYYLHNSPMNMYNI